MIDLIHNPKKNHLLIVDDTAPIREFYRDVAQEVGYTVSEAECAKSMADALMAITPSIILLDLTLPDVDGLELLGDLAEAEFTGPVILASGQDKKMIETAQRFGLMLGLDMPLTLAKPITAEAIFGLLYQFSQISETNTATDPSVKPTV